MTETGDRYRRRADAFEALVSHTAPERWTRPSPCEGWLARDVVAHVVDYSGLVLRERAGLSEVPVFADFDDPAAAFGAIRAVVERVLDDAETSPELANYLDLAVSLDLPQHGWDLAKATDQDPTIDPVEVEILWNSLSQAPKVWDWQRENGWYAAPVSVPKDAPRQERVLGLIGRDPYWTRRLSPAERWAKLREAWLDVTSSALAADPRVVGWGLVGSFGRGEADTWSDLDLLVFVRDADFDEFTSPQSNDYWSTADHCTDARRNAPAGATSVGSLYIRSGLPIGVDWYVYPAAMAAWPDDCDIKLGADAAPKAGASFAEWNGRGPRQRPLDAATSDTRQSLLAMVPIAGKYIARRSPSATRMIEFLGARTPSDEPRDQLAALRARVGELGDEGPAGLVSAVNEYLALVGSTIDS